MWMDSAVALPRHFLMAEPEIPTWGRACYGDDAGNPPQCVIRWELQKGTRVGRWTLARQTGGGSAAEPVFAKHDREPLWTHIAPHPYSVWVSVRVHCGVSPLPSPPCVACGGHHAQGLATAGWTTADSGQPVPLHLAPPSPTAMQVALSKAGRLRRTKHEECCDGQMC